MKQIVLILAVVALVGCEKKPLIADPIVEKAIRERLKKPEGELTKADLANSQLYQLYLGDTKTTDAGLKEVAKLQQLSCLLLNRAQITDAGVVELQKALPKCSISHSTEQ